MMMLLLMMIDWGCGVRGWMLHHHPEASCNFGPIWEAVKNMAAEEDLAGHLGSMKISNFQNKRQDKKETAIASKQSSKHV